LSGRWNDNDVQIACTDLINSCLNSPRVDQFIKQYAADHNGNIPAVLVGTFKNNSSEHLDTSIISSKMEVAIVNSGKLDFVAGGDTLNDIRNEQEDQQFRATEDTAVSIGAETGAALLLTGSVKAIVDRAGNRSSRTYYVGAELTNIQTRTRLWMGENSEIKKEIKQAKAKF
jgi:hypothetical protein